MKESSPRLRKIWNQKDIPVILRRTGRGMKLRVRFPYKEDTYSWLRNGRHTKPIWVAKQEYWELPKSWFNDLVNRSLDRFGAVYIIQPYREQEKCAPACLNATGHECQCSCMGANHGAGNDGSWFEVTDTFAARWGELELASRLLISKSAES